ncbi:M61 family metallopeptidase [Alteromonas sp. 5E99-2]|uniref:M61 family metallopeptidase n=1 Tax=Alteromonas sp. 5E99-2 TaxID=2817683 RepID=UPI001A99C1F8|nr:PDZ domain-containing protein [Alteromonas sp. 5E99-2]MBO1255734.1 M61 family metallopeptidase [Alteromonas sp. 5E99-2]
MISYHVSLLSLSQQTLKITVSVPAVGDVISASLPAWIPGSYKIRDFARNIGEFSVLNTKGEAVNWSKKDKQSWEIHSNNEACEISYTVIANDFSVRGAFINDDYAFMNGTSVFIDIENTPDVKRNVFINTCSAPSSWQAYTAMPSSPSPDSANSFICNSYYELIDHPIYWGVATVKQFEVKGVTFDFLLSGTQPIDINRITEDLAPICEHHLSLFGAPSPIDYYLFISLLADTGYGGLEHRDSTVLMYPRFDLPLINEPGPASDAYIDYLSLCSHEFFHTWHVKRLRPEVMLAPDLSKEVYTEQLWIYEGITSFYDDLTVARTGKMSPEHYLTILGRHLTRLYHTPGRAKQTPMESSFDAWTRFYQQDANSNNHIVSYYVKGGIIAMGLDILLRSKSNNRVSLDHVMQYLWNTFGKNEVGTPDNAIHTACNALGVNVDEYLSDVANGVTDVDLTSLLNEIGLNLEFRGRTHSSDKGGTPCDNPISNDFGATLSQTPQGLKVTQLQQGSAAEKANLLIGDKIIAANDWLVTEPLFMRLIQSQQDHSSIALTVARQGRLISLELPVQNAQQKVAVVSIKEKPKYLQWLGLEA